MYQKCINEDCDSMIYVTQTRSSVVQCARCVRRKGAFKRRSQKELKRQKLSQTN